MDLHVNCLEILVLESGGLEKTKTNSNNNKTLKETATKTSGDEEKEGGRSLSRGLHLKGDP